MANNSAIPKQGKLPKIGKLQKQCDTLLQQVGKIIYSKCEVCGKPISCLHHFFPKSTSARLRYDWDNLIPICNGCHMQHHQAGNPRIHESIIEKRGGKLWYDKVNSKSRESIKVNREYYTCVLEILNNKILRLHD